MLFKFCVATSHPPPFRGLEHRGKNIPELVGQTVHLFVRYFFSSVPIQPACTYLAPTKFLECLGDN